MDPILGMTAVGYFVPSREGVSNTQKTCVASCEPGQTAQNYLWELSMVNSWSVKVDMKTDCVVRRHL